MENLTLGAGEGHVGEGEAREGVALHRGHLEVAVEAVFRHIHQLPAAPAPEGAGLEDPPAGQDKEDDGY